MPFWRNAAQSEAVELTGTNAFRLMPDQERDTRPATGQVETAADGFAVVVRYG